MSGGTGIGMVAQAFSGLNQSGIEKTFTVSNGARYRPVPSAQLIDYDLYFNVHSTVIFRPAGATAYLILFFQGNAYVTDYKGYFIQIRLPSNSQNTFQLYNWNSQQIQSMLLVRTNTGAEFRLSVKSFFLETAKDMIDDSLPSIAQRNGDPIFTWEMWPTGIEYLQSDKRYLKLHQRLKIKPALKTYDATITYHIYLYIDTNGAPKAVGVRWEYWVESGTLSNTIGSILDEEVPEGLTDLVNIINSMLGSAAGGAQLNDLYYLPGDNTNDGAPQLWSHTEDDVTIVFEF